MMTSDASVLAPDAARTAQAPIRIGLIGLGTVGGGVYKILQERHPEVDVVRMAVKDAQKSRELPALDASRVTTDPFAVVRDPSIQVVVEVMGGVDIAYPLVKEALEAGKHVVTANKELIAKHGVELFALADRMNARLLFEGAVAGGIPIILPLKLSLSANRVLEIAGILNGTTNYILTKMTQEGWDFGEALKQAQAKGFAEADPTNDVEGFDTGYKLSILSGIAFGRSVPSDKLFREGISSITAVDIRNAQALGYTIKLIGLARRADNDALDLRVHPMLVPNSHPLASIHNEYNAIFVRGDAVGDVMFYGKGAGELPTASAVTADLLAITGELLRGNDPIPALQFGTEGPATLQPMSETRNRYYIRLNTTDLPGVIGNLGKACGEFGVSLDSVFQKGVSEEGTASIVLLTHTVREFEMQQALRRMAEQETTRSIGCVLRVL